MSLATSPPATLTSLKSRLWAALTWLEEAITFYRYQKWHTFIAHFVGFCRHPWSTWKQPIWYTSSPAPSPNIAGKRPTSPFHNWLNWCQMSSPPIWKLSVPGTIYVIQTIKIDTMYMIYANIYMYIKKYKYVYIYTIQKKTWINFP